MRCIHLILLAGPALLGQVHVGVGLDGRVIYSRAAGDPVFNAHGIGRPPKGANPHLWYVYDPYIRQFCTEEGVDPVLAKAVIWNESRFRWRAHSHAGAKGLMQLMPATAKRMGHAGDTFSPVENIRAGIRYLALLQTRYRGNLIKVAAAYNAGEGAVDRHGGIPPYKETQGYVPKVLWTWDWIQQAH